MKRLRKQGANEMNNQVDKIKETYRWWKNVLKTDNFSSKAKKCLSFSIFIMGSFFIVESLVVFKKIQPSYAVAVFGYICVILFTPPFFSFVREFLNVVNSKEKKLLEEVIKKNTYLEHATKILRHDMHSGINTYLPRGLRSLERRLDQETIKEKKLDMPIKLLKEGLAHTRQVYQGIFEFTNLVRDDATLNIIPVNLKESLEAYLKRTAYKDQVLIEELPEHYVNEPLFCTAIDNLIRNGLKYNDSKTKWVKIKMIDNDNLAVIDNGRGMTQEQFEKLREPYIRRKDQKESGSGLGLNICVAILNEHDFKISVKKLENGTMFVININNEFTINPRSYQ